jgi:hypothetical protein
MTKLPEFDQWIDAMSAAVRLEIGPEHRPGVKANLKAASKMAALLEKAGIRDTDEPAPVYRP